MPLLKYICWIAGGYLSGSLVWGYWISRYFYNIDIRTKGSGNIGATNVFRVLGPLPGIITFSLDVLKGSLPVIFAKYFYGEGLNNLVLLSIGFAAIAGSKFSIFLKGKGGKAVNCSFGVLLATLPREAIISLFLWILVFFTTGYVSLASIFAATGLPVFVWIFQKDKIFTSASIFIWILIVVAHKENIKRLLQKKENRFNIWKK